MTELEAELRRLAQWQDAISRSADKRTVELGGYNQSLAYTHAADLARDHEAAKREGGWMPIESAPRDETPFLAYTPVPDFQPITGIDVMWFDRGFQAFLRGAEFEPNGMMQATHWRPLPEPPVAGGAG